MSAIKWEDIDDDEENIEYTLDDVENYENENEESDEYSEELENTKEETEKERLAAYGLSSNENGFYCDNKKFYEYMVEYKQKYYAFREIHNRWLIKREAVRMHSFITVPIKVRRSIITEEITNEAKKLAETITEDEINDFLKNCPEPEKPAVSDYIARCIQAIAIHLSYRPNFSGYTYKDEFIADGIENCLKYIDNFDERYATKNPFSYFTTICWQSFVRRIQIERGQSVAKGMLMKDIAYNETFALDSTIEDETERKVVEDVMRNNHRFVQIAEEEEKKQKTKDDLKRIEKEEKKKQTCKRSALEKYFSNAK